MESALSNKSDTKRDFIWLFFKGAGMGAADVVPGVSGGTIAFITGIYARLLRAIKSVNLDAIKTLKTGGFKAAWRHIDGTFLLVLFSGLLTSAASLAKLITYLLEHHQLFVWSFFFGLIIASFVHVGKQVTRWDMSTVAACLAGAAIAFAITSLAPAEAKPQTWYYFAAGAIAICAMILPGISGSFILLLLGMYGHVLSAVNEMQVMLIALFLGGCVVGLMAFSRLLSWLLSRFEQVTFALLCGFLLGSLNLLWPWKQVLTTYTNSKGIEKPLMQANVLPAEFARLTGQDPQVLICALLAIAGLALILLIERISRKDA
ncbi:DUF368 domain-containing protein [Pseudoalteromonas sp. OOF1S-7]|uniref:DUF368 domain-containing protein n=1 Tax=Pseudoalteromonas sp. OOF1S-7 TaxID=2917757 RepID=UPI001EF3DF11|nr:DUF368 domain-containing protein [Pseudoalteromonas sp. OOF1S-7]MCG7533870.1 DUF368 domain-containing protein [Pseudoalteromonas sp. OOF1S-7]